MHAPVFALTASVFSEEQPCRSGALTTWPTASMRASAPQSQLMLVPASRCGAGPGSQEPVGTQLGGEEWQLRDSCRCGLCPCLEVHAGGWGAGERQSDRGSLNGAGHWAGVAGLLSLLGRDHPLPALCPECLLQPRPPADVCPPQTPPLPHQERSPCPVHALPPAPFQGHCMGHPPWDPTGGQCGLVTRLAGPRAR